MPFLAAIRASFSDHPPLRRIAAALAGLQPARRFGDVNELMMMFPGGVIR